MSEDKSLVGQSENAPDKPSEMPRALFKEFLDIQSREIEIRAREMDLRKQKDDHMFEAGKLGLEAQIQDRREQRGFDLKVKQSTFVFAFLVAVVFVALLITALALNKDQVALEIVKAAIFLASGGAGGYALGKHRVSSSGSAGTSGDKSKSE